MEERASWTTAEVRRLLDRALPSDADLRAFLLDALGHNEYQRIEGIQNRTQLVTEVLARHAPSHIVALLYSLRPVKWGHYQGLSSQSPTLHIAGLNRHAIGFWSLIRRETIWTGLFSSAVTLSLLLFVMWLRQPAGAPAPQLIIVQPSSGQALLDPEMNFDLPVDSPDEFVMKVEKAGLDNIQYRVVQEPHLKQRTLLRLVLALLKQNQRQIARMKYRKSQISEWQHDSRPQAQFLAKLTEQIEATLQTEENIPVDLGVAPRDGGLGPSDMSLVPTATHYDPPSEPKKRKKPKQSHFLQQQNSEVAAKLQLAQTEYENRNYRATIEIAKSVNQGGGARSWRLIGLAACKVKDIKLINEAYGRLDPVGRQYLIYACQRNGIQNSGNQFKLSD